MNIMKKIGCVLAVCLLFGLCGCRGTAFNSLFSADKTTIWISETPGMILYCGASRGTLTDKNGAQLAVSVTYMIGASRGVVYLLSEEGMVRSADTYQSTPQTLFAFTGGISADGELRLKIDPPDIGKVFDETVTEIVLLAKDSSETGFFEDTILTQENPGLRFELVRGFASDMSGYLIKKDGTNVLLTGDMFPYEKSDGFGAELYFYIDVPYETSDSELILQGTLDQTDGRYFFRIEQSFIGTVFDESVTAFELFPAEVREEKT